MFELAPLFFPGLLGWSVAWIVAGLIGLWVSKVTRFWRGFWFLSGLWAAVNSAIVAWALYAPPADIEEFRRLLLVNSGLDVGYLVVAVVLATRKPAMVKGFGAAIAVQGGYLLVYDMGWWWALG
jgi:hypothetical protein